MKHFHKSEAKIFKNSDACIAYEYPIGDIDINGALIELNGRYPDTGCTVNEKCKEIAYIVKGSGTVEVNGLTEELTEGDVVFIEPGEKFSWSGQLTIFMPCAPAWFPEQHKVLR